MAAFKENMNKRYASFISACGLVVTAFLAVQFLSADDHQAMASSAVGGRMIVEDGRYSMSQKRVLRQAILANADSLLDMRGSEIRAVLDQPELVRRDMPTVVWQYRNDLCVMDVYFTAGQNKVLDSPVVHYEARARHDAITDDYAQAICVDRLVRDNAPRRFVSFEAIYKSQ